MENTLTDNQPKKRPDRHGSNNPMWGRHHSSETRQKQSDAAIKRNQQYKAALDAQQHLSMDDYLSNNPVAEQNLKRIIKEVIDQYICTQTKPLQKALPQNIWL